MTSIIKVDTIQDQDGNNIINENANTITIGASGDTITIPAGATFDASASTTTLPDDSVTTAKIVDANVTLAKLSATGTKDATTFLRGDNTFDIPSVASLSTASGSAPSYSARAWVNFNGTGTVAIRDSGNVSSITDNGTGLYTVNFTTAMSDVNYSASYSVSNVSGSVIVKGASGGTYSTSAVQILCFVAGGADTDVAIVGVSIFR
jgi:hypothetical protein